MKLKLQRNLDRLIGVPLCRLLSVLPRKAFTGPPGPSNIVIILLSEMGSLVLADDMFAYLKKTYPSAGLYVMLFEKNREILEALDVVPRAHAIPIRDDSLVHMLADSIHAVRRMRGIPIDTVLDGELFTRISTIYSFLSGTKAKCGFHRHTQEGLYRGNFINRPLLYNPYLHISEQFINLAKAIESTGMPLIKSGIAPEKKQRKRITLNAAEKEKWVNQYQKGLSGSEFKGHCLVESQRRVAPYQGLAIRIFLPGGRWAAKERVYGMRYRTKRRPASGNSDIV